MASGEPHPALEGARTGWPAAGAVAWVVACFVAPAALLGRLTDFDAHWAIVAGLTFAWYGIACGAAGAVRPRACGRLWCLAAWVGAAAWLLAGEVLLPARWDGPPHEFRLFSCCGLLAGLPVGALSRAGLLPWRRAAAWAGLLLAMLGLVASAEKTAWVGIFQQEEYRFTFRDRHGRPFEGVQLRVENPAGTNFYHFPVTDYLPGQVPTSDANGVLVFHHAPATWVSGTGWWLFGVVPTGEHAAPAYVCRFLHGGREVHRVRYNDLVNTGGQTVKRRWKWLTWVELQEGVFGGLGWDDPRATWGRLFDLNGNGRIDRDEAYAAEAADEARSRAWEVKARIKPEWEELEFLLVEREVVLDLP
jgi:hypothetical protein